MKLLLIIGLSLFHDSICISRREKCIELCSFASLVYIFTISKSKDLILLCNWCKLYLKLGIDDWYILSFTSPYGNFDHELHFPGAVCILDGTEGTTGIWLDVPSLCNYRMMLLCCFLLKGCLYSNSALWFYYTCCLLAVCQ